MKHMFCSILLLTSCATHIEFVSGQAIKSPLVKVIDGFNISKIIGCLSCIREVRRHNYAKSDASPITLEMLVAQEHALGSPAQIQEFLKKLITNLVYLMEKEGYLQEFESVQAMFDELIATWASQHNRPHTILRAFTEQSGTAGAECDILCKKITTLRQYLEFLTDLEDFLHDVIESCPKSVAQYEAALAQFSSHK